MLHFSRETRCLSVVSKFENVQNREQVNAVSGQLGCSIGTCSLSEETHFQLHCTHLKLNCFSLAATQGQRKSRRLLGGRFQQQAARSPWPQEGFNIQNTYRASNSPLNFQCKGIDSWSAPYVSYVITLFLLRNVEIRLRTQEPGNKNIETKLLDLNLFPRYSYSFLIG